MAQSFLDDQRAAWTVVAPSSNVQCECGGTTSGVRTAGKAANCTAAEQDEAPCDVMGPRSPVRSRYRSRSCDDFFDLGSVTVRGWSGCASSTRPSRRSRANRGRHLIAIGQLTPSYYAISVFFKPSADNNTIRERCAATESGHTPACPGCKLN